MVKSDGTYTQVAIANTDYVPVNNATHTGLTTVADLTVNGDGTVTGGLTLTGQVTITGVSYRHTQLRLKLHLDGRHGL